MKLKRYLTQDREGFVLQEYLFAWYQNDKTVYKTLMDAKKSAQKKHNSMTKQNKKAKKDWRPNSFGTVNIYPMRIVDLSNGKKYPATNYDEKQFSGFKKKYLMEWVVHNKYSGRDIIVKGKTILWIYITHPEYRGLLWVTPDGTAFLNNRKIGKATKPDASNATHKKLIADVFLKLDLQKYVKISVRDFIEDMYGKNARGRIVEDGIYMYPSGYAGTELKSYDKMADKAIDMVYRYIDEKYTVVK